MLRDGAPLTWISGTSANGSGMVGTIPDHSMTFVRTAIRQAPARRSSRSKYRPPGKPVGVVTVACGEQVVRLTVRGVAVDLARVVEQIVVSRHLCLLVHGGGPVIQVCWVADEVTRGDHRIGMEGREKQVAVESIHAAAESGEAVDNVLPVEE